MFSSSVCSWTFKLWEMFVLFWVKYDIHLKQMRNFEHRKLSFCHDYLNQSVMFLWLHKHFSCFEVNVWPPLSLDPTPSELFPWGWEKEVAYCTNCNGIWKKWHKSWIPVRFRRFVWMWGILLWPLNLSLQYGDQLQWYIRIRWYTVAVNPSRVF